MCAPPGGSLSPLTAALVFVPTRSRERRQPVSDITRDRQVRQSIRDSIGWRSSHAKSPIPHDHHCCMAAGTRCRYCLLISAGFILPCSFDRMNRSKYRSIMLMQYPLSTYALYSSTAAGMKSCLLVHATVYRCNWLVITPYLHLVDNFDCGCGNLFSLSPFAISPAFLSYNLECHRRSVP